jgi:uncharacterized protein with HEPN domain
MKPRDFKLRLEHIVAAGEAIQQFVAGMTFESYQRDPLVRSAVERQFLIIGEALRHALEINPALAADITNARAIVNFRNVLAHDYEALWDGLIWVNIHDDLPRLLDEVRALLLR